jgi:hypothetical protein
MMNRAVITMLCAAALAGGAILYFWQRTPYEMEHRTLAGSTTTAIQQAASRIDFDSKEIDFGESLPVPEISGKFIIRNTGKSTLELQQPRPSCGCTVSSLSVNKLAPGEKAELKFTVSLRGIFGGDYFKVITVLSNDPSNGSVNLHIKGKVKPFVKIEPTEFVLGEENYRNKTNLTAIIRRLDGQSLNITNIVATNFVASASVIEGHMEAVNGGNGSEQRLQIAVSSGGKMGWFNNSIRLYSDDANIAQPIFDIPISGRWTDEVFAEPENLQWAVQLNAKWEPAPAARIRKVFVRSLDPDRPVKVTKMSASMDGFTFDLAADEKSSAQTITIKLNNYPAQTTTGTIVFETDNPTVPKVEIPFTVAVFDEKQSQ